MFEEKTKIADAQKIQIQLQISGSQKGKGSQQNDRNHCSGNQLKLQIQIYLSHNYYTLFLNYLPANVRNVTHKITLALLTNISWELFSQRVIVLGNKAHETSASRNYPLLGYTPIIFGELISVKIIPKTPGITQKYF